MTPVTDEERYRRVVEEGSNRKRDLAGFQRVLAREEQAEREDWGRSARVAEVRSDLWPLALERLRASVPISTFILWLEPLQVVGASGPTLVLSAPPDKLSWVERRYSSLIGEVLRDTEFEGIRLVPGAEG